MKSICSLFILTLVLIATTSEAMPAFARKYKVSCVTCHSAFPKLNAGGEAFVANNYRFDHWKQTGIAEIADDDLWLPEKPSLAFRMQGYIKSREDYRNYDSTTGSATEDNDIDLQSPYLIKALSSGALSDNLTYYFYAIFAEKGNNGTVVVEDAWFQYSQLFGVDLSLMLGQFQVSDLMFPREVRLPFSDFMAYRLAGITYERGAILSGGVAGIDWAIGIVNGNGISENYNMTSPGLKRPDHLFDRDRLKSWFGRLGYEIGGITSGVFALKGNQYAKSGAKLTGSTSIPSDVDIYGVDISGPVTSKFDFYFQYLATKWTGIDSTNSANAFDWTGGFLGIDYLWNDKWVFSLLQNYVDAGDFSSSHTVYRGLAVNSTSFTVSHYVARNAKLVFEVMGDWLETDRTTSDRTYGHQEKESSVLLGVDAAF
ncbi:MAG: hypothetical protein KDD61_09650 [Bdellovibrionales bacterium]|nr:hypothetical protein [Bdellovibrionales bacterium]